MSQYVKKRYFVLEGEEIRKKVDEAVALHHQHHVERFAFLEAIGAQWYTTSPFETDRGAIGALGFDDPETPRPGLRRSSHKSAGRPMFVPDMRTKQGRAIAKQIKKVGAFDFSTFMCRSLAVERSFIGKHAVGSAMYYAVIGVVNDAVVAVIPTTDKHPFTPPSGFREIRHSEYIAMTEEQPSERQAA